MLFPPGGKKTTLTIFALINVQSAIFTRAGRSRVSSKRFYELADSPRIIDAAQRSSLPVKGPSRWD